MQQRAARVRCSEELDCGSSLHVLGQSEFRERAEGPKDESTEMSVVVLAASPVNKNASRTAL